MMKAKVTRLLAFLCSLCMLIGSTAPMAKQQNAVLAYALEEGQTQAEGELESEAENSGYTTAGDGDTVSRVEWVSELTQLFEMTVEEDNYPDNYYSDIDSSSEYYYDVMLATEFGMVEVETGEQFCPDDPATREFAAHTLNFCLGYVLDEQDYTFNEAEEVTYADDIQVAVNQGWFELTDGAFLPEQALTTEEADDLLLVASEAIAATEINPEDSNYSLKDSVIIIPEEIEKEMVSDTELAFYDLDVELAAGDMFAVLDGGFPYVKKAAAVTTEGNKTTVIVTDVELEEAFDEYNVQGEISADLATVQAYSDEVQMTYIVGGTPEAYFSDGTEYATLEEVEGMEISAINARVTYAIPESVRKEFNLAPGVKAVLTCTISGVQVDHKSSVNTAQAMASAKVTFTCNVSMSVLEAIGASKSVELVKVPVGWGIYITLSLDLSIKGEITVALVEYVSAGFSFSNGSFRLLHNFYKESFTVTAQAEASAGLNLSASLDLVAFKASLYVKAGVKAVASTTVHGEGFPRRCTQVNAWMYASTGVNVKLNLLLYKNSWGKELVILDKWNSPVRVAFHYEDGAAVHVCSRDSSVSSTSQSGSGQYKYYTPITSRYGYSGANTGVDAYGEPFTLFNYTEGVDGITLTSYRGNVSALNIPETLDGHTVVGLGDDLFRYNNDLQIVIVPDTVTAIGSSVFENCTNLESVTLPDGLETLGREAFYGCTSLQAINIPNGLETINYDTFNKCKSLTEVVIPDSVVTINGGAFNNCSKLEIVTLSKNLATMEGGTFSNCDALTEIEIPKSLEKGGSYGSQHYSGAFENCDGLKEVTFEEGTTRVADLLFKNCTGLEKIEIPETVTVIESYAFQDCTNLKEVKMSDSVTLIESNAFSGCRSIVEIELSNGLTEIGGSAFNKCTGLTKIVIPDSVITINGSAFNNCSKLEDVTLSKKLVTMEGNAFGNCDALDNIQIPKSLEKGGSYGGQYANSGAFENCDGLKEVTFEEGTTRVADLLFKNCIGLEKIEIPETVTVIESYAFQDCTNLEEVKMSDSVTVIDSNAFSGCRSIVEIELSKSLSEIGGSAFRECTGLTKIAIPDSVITINGSAFNNCSKLEDVTLSKKLVTMEGNAFGNCDALDNIQIPKSLEKGGSYGGQYANSGAFENCDGLKEVTFEEGATRVARLLFYGCPGLEKIEIPDTVTVIESQAFEGCINLEEVIIPNSVTLIDTYAFEKCSSLTEIELSNSLTKIGGSAFKECTGLVEIIIPDSVTEIGGSAFNKCTKLERVILSKNLTQINDSTFDGCILLSEIVLPDGIKSVGSSAFRNCDALTSITIPNSVTSLGSYCFYSCDSLAEIDFGTGLTEIPSYAFDQCGKLTSIVLPYRLTKIQDHAFTNNPLLLDITIPKSVTTISSTAFNYYADITIYGVAGSYAETYAATLGAEFVPQEIPAETVQLNKTELTLTRNKSETLYLTIEPDNFTDTVTWKSSNTSVATVTQDGKVTAVAAGTATIRVTVGNKSASCKVTVLQPVTSISLNKTSLTMSTNDTYTLVATVSPSNANDKSVEWTSSDESVATVTQDGLVTAVGKGKATITVTAKDGSNVSRCCTVNVTRSNFICTTVEELESTHNYENSCTDSWTYTVDGAEYLKVTFHESTMMEDEFDFLYIYDGKNALIGEYTGAALAGETVQVTGDTVVIKLNTDSAGNEWGFKVTEVTSDLDESGTGGGETDGASVDDFVSRLYSVILGREADEASLAEWVGYLENGVFTGAEVAKGFIMSEEFLNKPMSNEDFVRILYSAFFGREAASSEVAAWVAYLDQGYRKSFIFSGFANSVEFGNLCESYGVEAGMVPVTVTEQQPNLSDKDYNIWMFVERMYTEVLDRTPDMSGIQGWADLLKAGTWTGAEVAEGFILSKEFLAKEMTNEEYVRIMYMAFFGREADQEGLTGWVNALETAYSKEFVFAGFANSAEFGVLCDNFGITQGSVPMPEQ